MHNNFIIYNFYSTEIYLEKLMRETMHNNFIIYNFYTTEIYTN
jgi:hypothetical protein